MAETKNKEKQLPFDKQNEIKPLLAYIAIVNQGNANAVIEIFRRAGSSASFVKMGKGTASKHVRDILGIEDNSKEIIFSLIPNNKIESAKKELEAFFKINKRNRGVGFSIPMTSLIGMKVYQFLTESL